MKKLLVTLVLITILITTEACAVTTPPSDKTTTTGRTATTAPGETATMLPCTTGGIYTSHEQFQNDVRAQKAAQVQTEAKLEEITEYLDFASVPEGWYLKRISVKASYVYCGYTTDDTSKGSFTELGIEMSRKNYGKDYSLIESVKRSHGADAVSPITICNSIGTFDGLVHPVYNGNPEPLSYQYYWDQNGVYVFVKCPAWLLEQYPEEKLFELKTVKID